MNVQTACIKFGGSVGSEDHTAYNIFGLVIDVIMSTELGIIDADERYEVSDVKPWAWWINDDADEENDFSGASSVPGQSPGNHSDNIVNGRSDLIDFFPVWLNLHDLLKQLPPSKDIQYKLKQANSALKAVYTDLTQAHAGSFLTVSNAVYGPAFDQPTQTAQTFEITASGVVLAPSFLQKIKDNPDKGVLLLEGTRATSLPLVLEIWKGTTKISQTDLPLRIDGVEAMYRWHNFRESPTISERLEEPSNRSDEICKNTDVFMAHGFRVPENEARAWGAEFFKRLYQEGMNARFHAVTWSSDTGASISYEQNVNNAFLTASNYAARVNAIKAANSSEVVVMGHSLGCMLTSAAIADGGMQADKFFALNGAVPAEAFDGSMANEKTNALNRLLHPEWRGYKAKTWASNWHRLFTNSGAFPTDDRAELTWRERCAPVAPILYNFWSSGDEVLEIAKTDIYLGSGVQFDWRWTWPPVSVDARRYVWHKQALFKGRSGLYGTTWAGWGFWEWTLPFVGKVYSREEANALDDETLRINPVFRHSPDEMLTSNIVKVVQNNLLSRGIPELSFPIGYTNVVSIDAYDIDGRNFDMNVGNFRRSDKAWPQRSIVYGDSEDAWRRWLHTDLINLPHYYTHELFKRIVTKGNMR